MDDAKPMQPQDAPLIAQTTEVATSKLSDVITVIVASKTRGVVETDSVDCSVKWKM